MKNEKLDNADKEGKQKYIKNMKQENCNKK